MSSNCLIYLIFGEVSTKGIAQGKEMCDFRNNLEIKELNICKP